MKATAVMLLSALLVSGCADQPGEKNGGAGKVSGDSLAIFETETLREWTHFNTTADSIVDTAGDIIGASRGALATPRLHQRCKLQRAIIKSNYSLTRLKKHIAAVEALETTTDTFALNMERRLDSIRSKFDREKIVLDRCLKELRELQDTQNNSNKNQ